MKPSDVLSVLQIINGVFQLVPFGAQTILGIKHLLAQDPAMAEGMQALLDQTLASNAATIAEIRQWRDETPGAPKP